MNIFKCSSQGRNRTNVIPTLVGDIVFIKGDAHRNQWPMGRVVEAIKSKDDEVRQARISIWKDRENKIYLRPIHELVLFMRSKIHSNEGDTSESNTKQHLQSWA